jgi:hypothetical protein
MLSKTRQYFILLHEKGDITMAKLPETALKRIETTPYQFAMYLENFEPRKFFEKFEERAEELDQKRPGQGYQLAYNEALMNTFGTLVTNRINGVTEIDPLSFQQLIEYFDSKMMTPYFNARKKEGLDYNIHMGMEALDPNMIDSFDSILDQARELNIINEVTQQFENGSLTLDSAYTHMQSMQNTSFSRQDARKLVAYAEYLENKNQNRSIFKTLFSLPTHFKELRAIEEMRALAAQQAPIADLLSEAKNPNPKIQNLIKDFETFKNKVSPILTDEVDPNLNKDPSETSQNELEISKIEADLIIINEDQQPSQSLQDSEVVNDATKHLHAFEKVVFKDSEFDHAPTNTKAAPVNTHEPTKDMQVVK